MINWGWGLAVFAGVYVAYRTGGHLNPAFRGFPREVWCARGELNPYPITGTRT